MPALIRRTSDVVPDPWPTSGTLAQEPWLKWPQEAPHQYYAFCAYRDLPPYKRNMANAWHYYRGADPDADGGPGSLLSRSRVPPKWSTLAARFRWSERAEAKDQAEERKHLDKMDEAVLEAYREMGERHAREAMALQAKALERLRQLNPADMSADTVLKYIVQAATLERLSRGASLRDLSAAQKEREQSGTVITYVDDWRGDQQRLERLRQEGSYYGKGQGVLPSDIAEKAKERDEDGGIIQRTDHKPRNNERSWWDDRLEAPVGDRPWGEGGGEGNRGADVPLPEPPPRSDGRDGGEEAVHLPQRGPEVA